MPNHTHLLSTLPTGAIANALTQHLAPTLFTHGAAMSPRHLKAIGEGIVAAFTTFVDNANQQAVSDHGYQLACAGLSHQGMVTILNTFRRVCLAQGDVPAALPTLVENYLTLLLLGYMAGREAQLLQAQAGLFTAKDGI